jgi:CRP-like cAMP-binding protein
MVGEACFVKERCAFLDHMSKAHPQRNNPKVLIRKNACVSSDDIHTFIRTAEAGRFLALRKLSCSWDILFGMTVLWNYAVISLSLAFPHWLFDLLTKRLSSWMFAIIISDFLYAADYILHISTWKNWNARSLCNFRFLAALPLHYLCFALPREQHISIAFCLLRMNKLVHFHSVGVVKQELVIFFAKVTSNFPFLGSKGRYSRPRQYFLKGLECAFLIFATAHLVSCFYAVLLSFESVPNFLHDRKNFEQNHEFGWSEYFRVLYWVVTFVTTVGYGDEVPITNGEKIFNVVFFGIGAVLMGIIIGSFQNLTAESDFSRNLFSRKKLLLQRFLDCHKGKGGTSCKSSNPTGVENGNDVAPSSVFQSVSGKAQWTNSFLISLEKNLQASWEFFHGEIDPDLRHILGPQLFRLIFEPKIQRDTAKLFFFRSLSTDIRFMLLSSFQFCIYSSEDILFHEGEAANNLFFILSGEILFFNARQPKDSFRDRRRSSVGSKQDIVQYSKQTEGYFSEGDFFLRSLYFCNAQCSASTTVVLSLSRASLVEILLKLNLMSSFRQQTRNNLDYLRKRTTESMVLNFHDHISNEKMRKMLSSTLGVSDIVAQPKMKLAEVAFSLILTFFDVLSFIGTSLFFAFPDECRVFYFMVIVEFSKVLVESAQFALFLGSGEPWILQPHLVLELCCFCCHLGAVWLVMCDHTLSNIFIILRLVAAIQPSSCCRMLDFILQQFQLPPGIASKRSLALLRVVGLTVSIFLLLHGLACGFCIIGRLARGDNSWIIANQIEFGYNLRSCEQIYATAIYWALYTISTVGYGAVSLETDQERGYAMLVMVFGVIFTAYLSSMMSNALEFHFLQSTCYPINPALVFSNSYLQNKLPHDLREKIEAYFLYIQKDHLQVKEELIFQKILSPHGRVSFNLEFLRKNFPALLHFKILKDERFTEVNFYFVRILWYNFNIVPRHIKRDSFIHWHISCCRTQLSRGRFCCRSLQRT